MKIGKKMVTAEALAGQRVHPNDSVLGSISAHPKDGLDGPGNNGIPYSDLIEAAISDRFWDSDKLFDAAKNEIGSGSPANTDEYTQMEANFSLIWGLAVQSYIRTLISDDAPYDQWAEAPGGRSPVVTNTKGILTESQMRGMDLFFTNTVGARGNCVTCHQGPFFTTATFPFTIEEDSGEFPEREQLVERMRRGDGVNIAENLFRYFIHGQGTVGGFTIDGRAGSWELPSIYSPAVSGDITLNGGACTVTSFLMNQDRTHAAADAGIGCPARATRAVGFCGLQHQGRRIPGRLRPTLRTRGHDRRQRRRYGYGRDQAGRVCRCAGAVPGLLPDPARLWGHAGLGRRDGRLHAGRADVVRHGVL